MYTCTALYRVMYLEECTQIYKQLESLAIYISGNTCKICHKGATSFVPPPDLIPITPLKSRCNKLKIYFCFLVPNLFSRTLPLTFFFSRFNSVEYSWIGETDWVYRFIVYISCKEQPSKVCKLLRKNQRDFCQYFKKGSALMF